MSFTRQELRRRVAKQILEPFFIQIPEGQVLVAGTPLSVEQVPIGGSFIRVFGSPFNFVGSSMYVCSGSNAGHEYHIYEYDETGGIFYVYPTPDNEFSDGDIIEIHTRTTASQKNDAINMALLDSYPYFYERVTTEIVIPEDTTELTSAHGLPTTWRRLLEVWLEPSLAIHGSFDFDTLTNLTVTGEDVSWTTNQWAGYEARFLRGDGAAGLFREIASNTATVLTWTTSLGLTTFGIEGKFLIADVENNRFGDWLRQAGVYPQGNPRLSSLLLGRFVQSNWGRKIRLIGIKEPSELDDDEDTTDVPLQYLIYHVCSSLLPFLTMREPSANAGSTQFVGRWTTQELENIRRRLQWEYPAMTSWFIEPQRDRGYKDWASNPFSEII